MCMCIYIERDVCMYVCLHLYVCVCAYAYMYYVLHMQVYVYVCIYICIHIYLCFFHRASVWGTCLLLEEPRFSYVRRRTPISRPKVFLLDTSCVRESDMLVRKIRTTVLQPKFRTSEMLKGNSCFGKNQSLCVWLWFRIYGHFKAKHTQNNKINMIPCSHRLLFVFFIGFYKFVIGLS